MPGIAAATFIEPVQETLCAGHHLPSGEFALGSKAINQSFSEEGETEWVATEMTDKTEYG